MSAHDAKTKADGAESASTAGLGGWCSGVRALVCMHCHRRDMPTDGPALIPKPRITQDGDCARHLDPPENDPFWGKDGLGTAMSDMAVF
mgnify:CR=1 FL=1